MKSIKTIIAIAAVVLAFASCKKEDTSPVTINVQLNVSNTVFAVKDVTVTLADAAGTNYEAATDATGKVSYTVPVGTYTASATYKTSEDGVRTVYTGTNSAISVVRGGTTDFVLSLNFVQSQQIIIKEVYSGGCMDNAGAKAYSNDAYFILYNNSDVEADASNIVFAMGAPYNAEATNKYYTGDALSYETADWMPAIAAMWWFTDEVVIPAYSQIVVAVFGGIDHTQTYTNSVNLANSEYYLMSNNGITQYTNAKYVAGTAIPSEHYLACSPFSQGNAWPLSVTSPAFYIARMTNAEALALSQNSDKYDHTLGTAAAFNVVKVPVSSIVDAVEVWNANATATSHVRFPASVNTGHVELTNKLGHTIYRNVDKEATEALAENAGKLVYNYAGGTADANGSTDPSGIDAEASIAAGAHIIYSETNNSSKDFHQRKVASLKK